MANDDDEVFGAAGIGADFVGPKGSVLNIWAPGSCSVWPPINGLNFGSE